MNKKVKYFWDRYINVLSTKGTQYLEDVYNSSSSAKQTAFSAIHARCKEQCGHHLSIISHSSMHFTTAYVTADKFVVDTSCNCYIETIDDDMHKQLHDIGVE